MNIVARMTIRALREHGVPELPTYDRALAAACTASPPPFGRKAYGDLYRSSASDPDWIALSLLTAAQSEGEGARHLWDMAACTPDAEIARQIQQHAIDEARHSRVYVTLLVLFSRRPRMRNCGRDWAAYRPPIPQTAPWSRRQGHPTRMPPRWTN